MAKQPEAQVQVRVEAEQEHAAGEAVNGHARHQEAGIDQERKEESEHRPTERVPEETQDPAGAVRDKESAGKAEEHLQLKEQPEQESG